MELQFQTNLKSEDMFRFNMYHTYTSITGYLSFVIAIAIVALAYLRWSSLERAYAFFYIALAIFVVAYTPISFYFKAKKVVKTTVLGKTLTYTLDEEGIDVSVPEQEGQGDNKLTYKQIYAIRQSKHNLLIYSTRVNAFVVPLESIEGQYQELARILNSHVDAHKLCKQIKNA